LGAAFHPLSSQLCAFGDQLTTAFEAGLFLVDCLNKIRCDFSVRVSGPQAAGPFSQLIKISAMESIDNLGVGSGDSPSRLDEREESRGQNDRGRSHSEF
jgi:hypothetical protein